MKPSITEIKVRGYHLDAFGHVNNARYLEFLEEGRWDYAEERLAIEERKQRGLIFTIVNININYRRPAFMGETLEIRTWVSQVGNASATIRQEIFLKVTGELVADADVTFVMVDMETNKPLPIPEDIRAAFEATQMVPAAAAGRNAKLSRKPHNTGNHSQVPSEN